MKKISRVVAVLLCICMLFTSCAPAGVEDKTAEASKYSREVQNLEKLCKVWGYTKYNHPAFLLGQKDWDEELLNLIPIVSEAKEDEVNGILHEWFVSLGEIDYKTISKVPEWVGVTEENKIVCTDTAWISEDYLGKELSADLQQFEPLPNVNRGKAPVSFSSIVVPDFSNEKTYENIDYSNQNYRLLGLFRVWNILEYYFPYFEMMDEDWDDLLSEYIPKMMEGFDLESFELTIMELTAHLHDAHVMLMNGGETDYLLKKYAVPVDLIRADGKFVIKQVYGTDCSLQAGDTVLKQDDLSIEDVATYFIKYISVPNKEKLANQVFPYLLRSDNQMISLTVLRDGKEEIVHVKGVPNMLYSMPQQPLISHEILEGNIGLINPSALKSREIDTIMQELRTTDGMIVDLRQYPSDTTLQLTLAPYFKKNYSPFVTIACPSQAVPGIMWKRQVYSGMMMPGQESYYYDKPVVILISETTQSNAEYTTMSLRTGENVTVLGNNSIGADGNITYLPLLNGHKITFTSLGIYTPDGGQTQRIGVSPDIEVKKTIEGIKEGRDEVKEAAIAYIQEQNSTKAK